MHKIVIGRQVLERLDAMLGTTGYEHLGKLGTFLLDEFTRAEVIDDKELPSQIVSMHRKVRFRDIDTDRETEATLVYPNEVGKIEAGLSVLTPVGAALLGLSEGQTIEYETPQGLHKSLAVVKSNAFIVNCPRGAGGNIVRLHEWQSRSDCSVK
jgi:regulator of nucleoside diphosphate kinase